MTHPAQLFAFVAPTKRRQRADLPDAGLRHVQVGTWDAAIVDELAPQPGDVVLDRTRMSVFDGTEIDVMLR